MRRLLPVLLGAVLVAAGLFGLLSLLSGRDTGGLEQPAGDGPGELEPVRDELPGDRSLPPTSGPHEDRAVTRQGPLDAEQLLTALEQGNVVIAYPPAGRPPPQLAALQSAVSGPFDPELAAAGQMIILVPWKGVDGVQALAYRRRLRAEGPRDPRLRPFAEAWLGQGRQGAG